MATNANRLVLIVFVLLMAAPAVVAQQSRPANQSGTPAQSQPASQTTSDAEREQIWNSPNMLRARAWLADHISKSAKITPEQGKKYMYELQHMSPDQMKLWLLKFDHEEDQRQQQYAFWQQGQHVLAQQSAAAHRATQQGYTNIAAEETASAEQEQGQLNEQAAARTERQEANQVLPVGPYGSYAPYGYGGYYPGNGGIHYHFHYGY